MSVSSCINQLPLVSIITVVFNGDRYLQQTIDSVKNQTYKNLEYIIIDGGSTDNTHAIIRENIDFLSQFICESDDGLYDAMNKGIKLANGELIGIINSDDWYEKTTVELVVHHYLQNPSRKIIHANMNFIYDDGRIRLKKYNPSEWRFLYYGMTYNHPTTFVHRDVYKMHVYNIRLRALSDYQFMLTNYLEDKTQFFYIDKTFANYRLGGISAQQPRLQALKEGFIARRLAGFHIVSNVFSLFLRSSLCFLGSKS